MLKRAHAMTVLPLVLAITGLTGCGGTLPEPVATTLEASTTTSPAATATEAPTQLPATATEAPLPPVISEENAGMLRAWRVFGPQDNAIRRVAFSPDSRLLASASGGISGRTDFGVRLWELESGRLVHTLTGHSDIVWDVAFSPDGQMLASASEDGTVRLWRVGDGVSLGKFSVPGQATSLAFSPDGSVLATGVTEERAGVVHLWRVQDGAVLLTFEAHPYSVSDLVFSPDGSLLATGAVDRRVKVWRASNGQLIQTIALDGQGLTLDFHKDGTGLAVGQCAQSDASLNCLRGEVWFVDPLQGGVYRVFSGATDWIDGVSLSPAEPLLAGASREGAIYLWRLRDAALVAMILERSRGVQDVVFSPDGKLLAASSSRGVVVVWAVPIW